jgi:hypothetical protein
MKNNAALLKEIYEIFFIDYYLIQLKKFIFSIILSLKNNINELNF